ncbi:MAG: hypothetical protein LAT78_14175 [Roseinatronobacter sp.]|nr:hypothetical protein [Roseinatronobacter sp.]
MFTRSAVFRGQIHAGMEEAFFEAVRARLLPAWRQMLHAQDVRVYRPCAAEEPLADVFLIQEIDYPSQAAIAEALASERRQAAVDALASVRHMYDGSHSHIISERL